jgi:hypothetical protein
VPSTRAGNRAFPRVGGDFVAAARSPRAVRRRQSLRRRRLTCCHANRKQKSTDTGSISARSRLSVG